MLNKDKFIRKTMAKLCLKNGLTLMKIAFAVSFWIGRYAKIGKANNEEQIEIGDLLNKGYQKGLFGEEL